MDQRSLKYLTSQRLLEGIQHKLMMKLIEFDYAIEYKKGSQNTTADSLSRKEQTSDSCLAISAVVPSWLVDVEVSYVGDTKCVQLLQELALNLAIQQHYTYEGWLAAIQK
jgi:hypothetical protein